MGIILMGMYSLLLVFVLFTHKDIMNAEGEDESEKINDLEMSPHLASKEDIALEKESPKMEQRQLNLRLLSKVQSMW